jgi:hypothetical protein
MVLSVWVLVVCWKMVSPKTKNLSLAFLNLRSARNARAPSRSECPTSAVFQNQVQAATYS